MRRALALVVGVTLGATFCWVSVSAQTESASAEDGKSASDAPAETTAAPEVPLGANVTPPLGPLAGQAIIHGPGSGQSGSSSVSMEPGTLTTGVAREGENAVRAPETEPEPAPVAPAPEPVAETPPEPVVDEPIVTEAAPAGDLDADNYPDELEWDLGLDPNNIDTDADGVADGDELNIYGTEPTVFDTDGDGIGDGAELFDTRTDPLLWEDFTAS